MHVAVNATFNGSYSVSKNAHNKDVVAEVLKTTTKTYGKKTESIKYRDLDLIKADIQSADSLKSVEIIAATNGDDTMRGGDWDDIFLGLGGDDIIDTAKGDDLIDAGDGDDNINAGAGNDIITQSDDIGSDTINGADGIDTLNLKPLKWGVRVDLAKQSLLKGENLENKDKIIGIEKVIGTDKNDIIIGDESDNVLVAADGYDVINGGGGNDTFVGNAGVNWLFGANQDDTYALKIDAANFVFDAGGKNLISILAVQMTLVWLLNALVMI